LIFRVWGLGFRV